MLMVDRYTWTKSDMERSTDGFWVTAHDYDALAVRLAEAERLLADIRDDLEIGAHPQLHADRIRAYFGTPDSAEHLETVAND